MQNNILTRGTYGVKASGVAEGNPTFARATTTSEFKNNILIGPTTNPYPPSTRLLPSINAVGFASLERRDYRIGAPAMKGTSAGRRDPGADVNAVVAATASVSR
jgi:hypothetical protein